MSNLEGFNSVVEIYFRVGFSTGWEAFILPNELNDPPLQRLNLLIAGRLV